MNILNVAVIYSRITALVCISGDKCVYRLIILAICATMSNKQRIDWAEAGPNPVYGLKVEKLNDDAITRSSQPRNSSSAPGPKAAGRHRARPVVSSTELPRDVPENHSK